LAQDWDAFAQEHPDYDSASARQKLSSLSEWFRDGPDVNAFRPLPNIILTPLVVIGHLVEYVQYQRHAATGTPGGENAIGTLGLCTGLMGALVVALSKDLDDVQKYGSTAIRIAVLIGGVVDGQDAKHPDGPSVALTAVWNSPASAKNLDSVLEGFSDVST
jgi:hypothetical protein